jgi:hypothetical protein
VTVGVYLLLAVFFFFVAFLVAYEYYKPECLKKGYPYTEITYTFEPYCISMDGTKVIKLDED